MFSFSPPLFLTSNLCSKSENERDAFFFSAPFSYYVVGKKIPTHRAAGKKDYLFKIIIL